jgi:hypothetical protein
MNNHWSNGRNRRLLNHMKFLKKYGLLLCLALILAAGSDGLAQQKRQPAKPTRKPAANSSTQANTPTFDTLLASDRYKIYVEVRGVGQLIKSSSVSELLDPVIKLAAPPKEFKTLVKWLNTHADDVMTSRLLVAAWPSAKNVPDAIVAIEFDSAEEAVKFAPQLNSFLPKVLPTPAPEPSSPPDEKQANTKAEEEPAKPSYYLKQVGSLILITPTPLTLKNLRPPGSKLLADQISFRVARNRFTSEQLFLYVDVHGIETEEENRRKQFEDEDKKRTEEQAKLELENPTLATTPTEEEKDEPDDADKFTPPTEPAPQEQKAEQMPTPDPISSAMGLVANSFFAGQAKWPDAIGVGVSFETDSFDARALMITAPGEKCDAVPFFPNLIPGPPIVPESPSILPADTELFATLSLDLPQIYAAINKAPSLNTNDKPEMTVVKDTALGLPFTDIERLLKINVKEDLLPLLGSELVISMPVKALDNGSSRGPLSSPTSAASSENDQKPAGGPSFVVALSLRDKEGMKALLPKIVDSLGFKGASALAQTERREDTEIVSYANMFSYAFIGNFLLLSADVTTTRHVVDSYLKHETLSSDSQFKNFTRWQPRQLQAQVYASPALMESYRSWADQPNTLLSDQTREFLSRLSVLPQPVTYSLSNDGLGTMHELHVPKNLVLMAVAGISAESNPSPIVANERATIGALYMIANVETQYRSGEGQGSFGSLEKLIESEMVSKEFIETHGYKIEVMLSGSKFEVTATPLEYGKTGKTSYYIDETNVLRGGDHGGGMATVADKPIQ